MLLAPAGAAAPDKPAQKLLVGGAAARPFLSWAGGSQGLLAGVACEDPPPRFGLHRTWAARHACEAKP